jgi:hypothetical protein
METFRKEDYLSVKDIWKELERKVSIRHIYNLIERGTFGEGNVYRFAGRCGTCVTKTAVAEYKKKCQLQVGM